MSKEYSTKHKISAGLVTASIILIAWHFLFAIVAVVLTWALTDWSKKAKTIITLLIIALLGLSFFASYLVAQRAASSVEDAERMKDVTKVHQAQQQYYAEEGIYYTSAEYPSAIGEYLPETPLGPSTGESYGWIDNIDKESGYCVYFKSLQLQEGSYFVFSHYGMGVLREEPRTITDCERAPSFRARF